MAYGAFANGRWVVSIDGTESPVRIEFPVGRLVFSPDGRRLAFVVGIGRSGPSRHVVVDDQPGPAYDWIQEDDPVFSPDSRHVAYRAQTGEKWALVVDGVSHGSFDGFLNAGRIVFDNRDHLHVLAYRGQNILRLEADIVH